MEVDGSILKLDMDFSNLSKISRKKLIDLIEYKKVKKGELIYPSSDSPENFYIIKSGIAKSYYRNEKGKEFIRNFYFKGDILGSLSLFLSKSLPELNYDCLTDCEVFYGNFETFKTYAGQHKDICAIYSKILESVFIKSEKRVFELSNLNATERYIKLKTEIPEIENLIQQYHIASYLNITPVQLSRIRKDIFSK